MPSAMIAAIQITASTMVIRSRFFSTTEEPPCCEVKPPPNMSERPPPLPLCSSTKTISSRLVTARMTSSAMTTCGSSLYYRRLGDGGRGRAYLSCVLADQSLRPGSTRRSGVDGLIAVTHDPHEVLRVQGGAADQRAVDVRLGHDPRGVRALDRAAVQDAHLLRGLRGDTFREPAADRADDLLRVGRGGHLAGADRPDRLVRDHGLLDLLRGKARERAVELGQRVRDVFARLADLQPIADAHDRAHAAAERRLGLGRDQFVGLAVVLAPLRVPDHDVRAAELGQHGRGDLSGVRARGVLRDVLRAVLDLQLVAVDQGLHRAQVGERGEHRDLDRGVVLVGQGEGELLDVRDGLEVVEVHLPVARHQRGARVGHAQPSRTVIPGNALPSRYSSDAPPPVEMWPNAASSKPRVRTAAAESPPPTTVNAPESIRPCATARVPPA